ncbi:MAG: HTH domain-containing protein [Bacteroidales bacterium]|nr:HTH domain-containing protein [Bacteroidales bacterium]
MGDLLARTDFMEKAGTGIKRVTNACKENGNEVDFEFSDSFWVTIKSNIADNVTYNVIDNVTDSRKKQIIRLIQENNKITLIQMAKKLSVTRMTIVRDIAQAWKYLLENQD